MKRLALLLALTLPASAARIELVAGCGTKERDEPAKECELARPHGVTIGSDGLLYITDSYNDRILRIVP